MKEGDNCPICEKYFKNDGTLTENSRSKVMETRLVCSNNIGGQRTTHVFSRSGKLYYKRKTIGDQSMCPRCGLNSGMCVGINSCSCHTCGYSTNNGKTEEWM